MKLLLSFLLSVTFFITAYSMQPRREQIHRPASILWQIPTGRNITRDEKLRSFINDCNGFAYLNNDIPEHQINNESVRIATYNVHYWTDPFGGPNFDNILHTIGQINADVLILQEVSWGPTAHNRMNREQIKQAFRDLGYEYFLFGQAANLFGAPFGNIVISKYPFFNIQRATVFDGRPANIAEDRCFVKVSTRLPNNASMTVYGTHLDVFDETGAWRGGQVAQMIQHINNFQQDDNVLIAADFNEARQEDYRNFMVGLPDNNNVAPWGIIMREHQTRTRVQAMPSAVSRFLREANFQDCFTRSQSRRWPLFTVWSGTAVDFIYLAQTWNLPILGCYMYYNAASDHLPVIMDVDVQDLPL